MKLHLFHIYWFYLHIKAYNLQFQLFYLLYILLGRLLNKCPQLTHTNIDYYLQLNNQLMPDLMSCYLLLLY